MKALEHTAPVDASKSGLDQGRESEAVRSPSEPSPSNTTLLSESQTAGLSSQEGLPSKEGLDENRTRLAAGFPSGADVAPSGSDAVSRASAAVQSGSDADLAASQADLSPSDGVPSGRTDEMDGAQASDAAEVVRNFRFGRVVFRPSKTLEELAPTLVDARGIPVLASLSDDRLARICREFGLEETLILRWRDMAKATVP